MHVRHSVRENIQQQQQQRCSQVVFVVGHTYTPTSSRQHCAGSGRTNASKGKPFVLISLYTGCQGYIVTDACSAAPKHAIKSFILVINCVGVQGFLVRAG